MSDTPIYDALVDEYGGELPTVETPNTPDLDLGTTETAA